MKLIFATVAFLAATGAPPACSKSGKAACYKGRLEEKGVCGNITMTALNDNVPGTAVSWTNEQTGKTYNAAFKPLNPCNLPDTLKEGDTFYFVLDTANASECMTCNAYYPAPEKRLNIRVVRGPCTDK